MMMMVRRLLTTIMTCGRVGCWQTSSEDYLVGKEFKPKSETGELKMVRQMMR
jgi:hypothetical protein